MGQDCDMGHSFTYSSDELPREFVLSRRIGVASDPKDFEWVETNIPCQAACPAGTDIPGYLDAIAHGDFEGAYRINLRDNVFPAVLGRVCSRPCEPACRHGWEGLGDPVAICFSKRSAEEFMRGQKPVVLPPLFEPTPFRIAVIGGGAAGLTVARELTLLGHTAIVFEKHSVAGGMMVQGIPAFRLPRELVAREVEQIRQTGVEIRCNQELGRNVSLEQLLQDFDVVSVSPGTLRPFVPDLPGIDLDGIQHGLPFLFDANTSESHLVDGEVVVIGGGYTAVDCARTAKRLGAKSVTMLYRRSRDEMYITPEEVEEMEAEGVTFYSLAMPVAFHGETGRVTGAEFSRVELGDPDESGRRCPEPVPGTSFIVEADTVLLATGQTQDASWIDEVLREKIFGDDGRPIRKDKYGSMVESLYFAGDFATGAISLIDAIGHAKGCAREIDRTLMGADRLRDVVHIRDAVSTGRTREMDTIPRHPMPTLELGERDAQAEVETGLDKDVSRAEASRCYLCDYKFEIDNDLCIYCDRCLKVKPVENCIVKISALEFEEDGRIQGVKESTGNRDYNGLFIDQNECIRCGACVDVCPVECISLQRVSRLTVRETDIQPEQ
jgi:NADPH-dependent glutamate synthase beta subunit-like oxidoreductase/ferredoxin